MRRLGLVFGNTTHAASATLAVFFLGLAVGAALAGVGGARLRWPLRVYGLIECALGLYAALTPWAFDAALPLYRAVYRAAPDAPGLLLAVQVCLCLAVLGPPTVAMGATLPILSAGLARRSDALSARIGRLYGWNTAGAALGTLLTGFVFLGRLGVTHTIWLGAAGSLSVGLLALWWARGESPLPAPAPAATADNASPAAPAVLPGRATLVLGVMAVSGGLGLAYEITWTRLSVFALSTTAYAFAVMLVTYLVGLALGGLGAARFLRRRRATVAHLAWAQLGIGLTSAASLWALTQLPTLNRAFTTSALLSSAWGFYGFRFAQCVLVMLLPTLCLGATFPLAVSLLAPAGHGTSRTVGRLYAWNTLGGVLGSLLGGFVLIPALGTRDLLRVGVAMNAVLALVLLLRADRGSLRRGGLALAAGCIAVAFGLGRVTLQGLFTTAEFGSFVVYQDEGITGTVTIHEYPETGVRVLSINGCNVAGTTLPLLTTQKIQGHVPALLHGRARSAMQIGFGSGETAKVLRLHGLDRIDGVEISPEVIRAGDYLSELNGQVAYSREFHPIIMDAVNYVRLTDRTYDLILNDSTFPGLAGSSALYTRDHFAACAARLNPGGIFSCWIPLDVTPATFRMILASLVDVFPYTQLWLATNCDNKNALLVGSRAPLRIDLASWEGALARPQVEADLYEIRLGDIATLTSYLLVDSAGMRALAAGAPLNTHDHPRLEYAPFDAQGYRSRWAENLTALLAHRPDVPALFTRDPQPRRDLLEDVALAQRTNRLFLAGLLQDLRTQGPAARALYERVLAERPSHRGAQYALAKMDASLRRVRRQLSPDATDPATVRRLAEAYWRAGYPREALPLFQQLAVATPNDGFVEERLVLAALAAGDPAAAEPVLDRVVARHPTDPAWRFNRGLARQLAARPQEAVAEYTALLETDPTYQPARFALARLYMQLGDFAAGERVLRGDTTARASAEWHRLLALAQAGQGRLDAARSAAMEAVRLAPDSAEARDVAAFFTPAGNSSAP